MHLDPALSTLVGALLAILIMGIILNRMKQPHVVGYLITGVILGPHVFGLINDQSLIERLGAMGVVFLLFFVGMEISPKKLLATWKITVVGTSIQIFISIACVWLLGKWLDWPLSRIILLGFVISLSSTAVVLKILQDNNELETDTGQNVLDVLLFQDMAIIAYVNRDWTNEWHCARQPASCFANHRRNSHACSDGLPYAKRNDSPTPCSMVER